MSKAFVFWKGDFGLGYYSLFSYQVDVDIWWEAVGQSSTWGRALKETDWSTAPPAEHEFILTLDLLNHSQMSIM